MATTQRIEHFWSEADCAKRTFFETHAWSLLTYFPLRFLAQLTPAQLGTLEDELWAVGQREGISGITPERIATIRKAVDQRQPLSSPPLPRRASAGADAHVCRETGAAREHHV